MNVGKMAEWNFYAELEKTPYQVGIDQDLEFCKDQLPCCPFGHATPDEKSGEKEKERHPEAKKDHVGGDHCLGHGDAAGVGCRW